MNSDITAEYIERLVIEFSDGIIIQNNDDSMTFRGVEL